MSVCVTGLITATCTYGSGAGSLSVPGLKVGDLLVGAWNLSSGTYGFPGTNGTGNSGLEPIITVDDQIQQLGTQFPNGVTVQLFLLRVG